MTHRVSDLLAQRAADSFVGREPEMSILLGSLAADGPLVLYVHGPPGIGKSSLLELFAARARSDGVTVVPIDCHMVEPTERGFLHELGHLLEESVSDAGEAAGKLGQRGPRVVLVLDNYEVFRLLDTWLRGTFLPQLPDTVRVVLASREPPVPPWLTLPAWHGLFRSVALEPLQPRDTTTLLRRAGIKDDRRVRELNRLAHGNPLALKLAAAAALDRPGAELEDIAVHEVFEQLTTRFLDGVDDPATRELLRAASVVRRITHSLLDAIRCGVSKEEWDQVQHLPFVDACRDGLRIHDAFREAVAASFRATDPEQHLEYRRRAWGRLREEIRAAGQHDLWRYTADMLYLIENPVVREAFFPSGEQSVTVEPALEDDFDAIGRIIQQHEAEHAARCLEHWRAEFPDAFRVARDRDGRVVGFYCMGEAGKLPPSIAERDPVVEAWFTHLEQEPVGERDRVLLLRRWLSEEWGEVPSPIQAACWLDIKRAYMELRPSLRRVYLAVVDLATYAPVATQLGFRPIESAACDFDGLRHHTAMLDFGPGSVDGWIARLVAGELGIEQDDLLDRERHCLVLDGKQVALTPLEYRLLEYLCDRRGRVATRDELLRHVWGQKYASGSNVVDAVVKSLRRKLGGRQEVIETVRGFGYRLFWA